MEKQYLDNGWYIWVPNFYSEKKADVLLKELESGLNWKGGEVKVFGKTYEIPRRQVLFANKGFKYGYSGKTLEVQKWDETVLQVKTKIEESFDFDFNACLANLYRDGQDSNGWHSDNEKELGENPIIGSVSLGNTRKFQLKHTITNERKDILLTHGSLLVMGGEMQHYWKHQITKTKKAVTPRVNLTFRKLKKDNSKP